MNDKKLRIVFYGGIVLIFLLLLGASQYQVHQMKDEIEKDFYFESTENGCNLYTDEDLDLFDSQMFQNAPNSVYDHKISLSSEGLSFVHIDGYHNIHTIYYDRSKVEFNGGDYQHYFNCGGDEDD